MSDREERKTEKQHSVGWEAKGIHIFVSWPVCIAKSPSYDHTHCRCTNYSSCTTRSFSRKSWALLWKSNQWSKDTITQSLSCSASLLYMQQGSLSISFSSFPSAYFALQCLCTSLAGREKGRRMSNTCCSFASPPSRLLCPSVPSSTH